MRLKTRGRSAALLYSVILGGCNAAYAAAPNAASILQQMHIDAPVGARSTETMREVKDPTDDVSAPGIAFVVKSIEITGNVSIPTSKLHALVEDVEGQTITLAELYRVVARITAYYQTKGFALSRAIVPGQTIVDGLVVVQVIEARYDSVALDNHSHVRDALVQSALIPLQSGQVLRQGALDYALLTLSDIAGVAVNATIRPGAHAGGTELEVSATASGKLASGSTVIDNYGSNDGARASQTVHLIDPFNLEAGATLDMRVLSAAASLSYASVTYESLLSGVATYVGGSYSALQYEVGGALTASDTRGEAQVFQVWARHTLVRSYASSVYGQVQYEKARLGDHSGAFVDNIRQIDKVTLGLTGDLQDRHWLGATNQWNLKISYGFTSTDGAGSRTDHYDDVREPFTKVSGTVSRLQTLGPDSSLFTALALQWASQNLDPAEKFTVGGAGTVRATTASALSGDIGALFDIEYRHHVGSGWGNGNWQLTAFWDGATLQFNQTALGTGENRTQLNGLGIGLLWTGSSSLSVKVQLAKLLNFSPVVLSNETGALRGWVEINRTF
jgi:hemolysin activation/secretion protein